MTDEMKRLIEDAARLLWINGFWSVNGISYYEGDDSSNRICYFNPLDPERGDLMKVAMAAKLIVGGCLVSAEDFHSIKYSYPRGDYDSLALAVLRAASAVLKAREGE